LLFIFFVNVKSIDVFFEVIIIDLSFLIMSIVVCFIRCGLIFYFYDFFKWL